MSDTPRTDAECYVVDEFGRGYRKMVSAEFARQLERELRTAQEDNRLLHRCCEDLEEVIKERKEELSTLKARMDDDRELNDWLLKQAAAWKQRADQTKRQLASEKADAERYRWLRETGASILGDGVAVSVDRLQRCPKCGHNNRLEGRIIHAADCNLEHIDAPVIRSMEVLDAAIDRALKSYGEGKK